MKYDYIVVGAGCAGCTIAERLASESQKHVLLVEKRKHIGGNAYDFVNNDGLYVQQYGPHIFHTNNALVWEYLSKFTTWNSYEHRVLAQVDGQLVPFPINKRTLELILGKDMTDADAQIFFNGVKVDIEVKNSRDVIVSQVGERLYNLFFKNYTKKQWGVYPEELSAEVTRRIPVRTNDEDRYFTDSYQGIPTEGFSVMFSKMITHPLIEILTDTDFKALNISLHETPIIYTGPIDEFFNYKFGHLPYRSLQFEFQTLNKPQYQEVGVINYPNDFDYTRITEFKHFYLHKHAKTTICFEFPQADGDPYYPIPRHENAVVYEQYVRATSELNNVHFIGRLAEYRYLNMDQAIMNALKLFGELSHGS